MKKALRFLGIFLIVAILLFVIYAIVAGKTYMFKALVYNYVDIDDIELFHNRKIEASNGVEWPFAKEYNKKPMPTELRKELENFKSVAFLVIKNDSLLYENYWEQYTDTSLSNSFSMAKSFVSVMIGIAIQEGKIKSIDQPVGDFIPEYKTGTRAQLTIRHLLTMSAALSWDEGYASLTSPVTEAYYGTDLFKLVKSLEVVGTPGKNFNYQSSATELLSIVLANATNKSLSEYASEKLWQPLQAMHAAEWSLDHEQGREKAYCCFYSNARDFARIGSLYLHDGNWKGKQLVDTAWVRASTTPAPMLDESKPNEEYGYQWWIGNYSGKKIFYCRGILGQYIVVIPDEHIVFVRLGHKRDEIKGKGHSTLNDLPLYVKGVLDWIK